MTKSDLVTFTKEILNGKLYFLCIQHKISDVKFSIRKNKNIYFATLNLSLNNPWKFNSLNASVVLI